MVYKVVRAEEETSDLDLIFDYLVETAEHFGEDLETAFLRAEKRVIEIQESLESLANVPHQGTLRPHLGNNIRNVTKIKAIIYFEVDDDKLIVRVLAVFYSGQNHDAHILLRLLS
ncbi:MULTISPECIES: type II toxin-antitoxin system RelE/ParE family toxin [Ruegeria]|uniref:type II toxin-antitoxin system RelE/ParE family toxin n=1 Tax=Ruegeria sp. HKCCA5426 TaxID=2682985 RepID=UPI00147D8BCA